MNIGNLNKRITFQSKVNVSDSMGGFTSTWKDEATVWAAIWPLSASEQVQAAQQVMTISHRIRIRYLEDVKASWRVKYKTKYFDIKSIVNPNLKNELLDLMCKEAAS